MIILFKKESTINTYITILYYILSFCAIHIILIFIRSSQDIFLIKPSILNSITLFFFKPRLINSQTISPTKFTRYSKSRCNLSVNPYRRLYSKFIERLRHSEQRDTDCGIDRLIAIDNRRKRGTNDKPSTIHTCVVCTDVGGCIAVWHLRTIRLCFPSETKRPWKWIFAWSCSPDFCLLRG